MKLKDAMTTEHLLNHKYRASIGQAWAVAKSASAAKLACEEMVVDIMRRHQYPRIEIRSGYLIVSQIESSDSAWYTIKKLSDLVNDGDQSISSSCHMRASALKEAIDSHMKQYLEDDVVMRTR